MRRSVVLLLGLFFLGCYTTGPYFPPPRLEEFALHKTTKSDLMTMLGEPEVRRRAYSNGEEYEEYRYAHWSSHGIPIGKGPIGRSASFWFSGYSLVGYIYTSNWPGESTDFDQSLLPRIVEGESTRTDVEALLGRPTGLKVFPIIDNEEDLMISYFYVGKSGFAGMSGSVVKKAEYLVGKDGVVKEISVKIESH